MASTKSRGAPIVRNRFRCAPKTKCEAKSQSTIAASPQQLRHHRKAVALLLAAAQCVRLHHSVDMQHHRCLLMRLFLVAEAAGFVVAMTVVAMTVVAETIAVMTDAMIDAMTDAMIDVMIVATTDVTTDAVAAAATTVVHHPVARRDHRESEDQHRQ